MPITSTGIQLHVYMYFLARFPGRKMFQGREQFPRAFKVKNAMTPRMSPLTPLPSELRYVEESNV